MAGVSTPEMAAAVSEAGGLGAIAVGAMDPVQARAAIHRFRALSTGPLNVNVFVHRPAVADPRREAAWLQRLAPFFAQVGGRAPEKLREIYRSFLVDDDMLAVLVEARPAVVSFHFGVPRKEQADALRAAGSLLLATATSVAEARAIQAAGLDAIVAQGYEAGGHRGMFDPDGDDPRLGTLALVRLLATGVSLPVIAAGGIMDGAGIAAALALGADGAQLGTAFIATDESLADADYRTRLGSQAAHCTVMTRAVSGRPARSLASGFTALGVSIAPGDVPDYPIAYDAGKALHAAAKIAGPSAYGAYWAGQGAPLARTMSTRALMRTLVAELDSCLARENPMGRHPMG